MLKKGSNLPDDDHVMRHVSWNKLRKDEDENVLGFLPQAFELRPEEQSLSVNWLEYFPGDHANRIKETVRAFRKTITVRSKSVFGIAKVGVLKDICRSSGASIRIVYAPTFGNSSHAQICNLPREDLALLEAMAADAFQESVRNAEVE